MLDGMVLQIVLVAVWVIVAVLAAIWFVVGITKRSAVWIITCAVPIGLIVAVVLAFVTA